MPRMIGSGCRKRVASRIASSCVLSPISASATTAVEVNRASMTTPGPGGFAIPIDIKPAARPGRRSMPLRSEEHTSELQSLLLISYAVYYLKTKKKHKATEHYKQ